MDSTVIYVSFGGSEAPGPEKVRRVRRRREPVRRPQARPGFRIVRGAHGLMDLYSTAQVSRLLGIPRGRLRWWSKCGLITPGEREGSRRLYTFRDLISLKAARDLTEQGMGATRIKRAIRRLTADLGAAQDPLVKLRVYGNDRRLVLERDGHDVEAETGQILIHFKISRLAEDADRTVAFDPSGRRGASERSAYEWFLEATKIEEDESRWDEAEAAYRTAMEMDPSIAAASTNLGNLLFRRGKSADAEDLYRRAIQGDPDQPQAYYNLGFLKLDSGRADLAIVFLHKALTLDPEFADARFNLGVALEREGRVAEARREFVRFLSMDSSSPWAKVARMHLQRIDGGTAP